MEGLSNKPLKAKATSIKAKADRVKTKVGAMKVKTQTLKARMTEKLKNGKVDRYEKTA